MPVTCVWSIRLAATVQFVVVWQASQVFDAVMWVCDLPVALVPLWQEKQVPVTCVWSTRLAGTGAQSAVVWQASQVFDVVI